MNARPEEVTWMRRALALARRARGDTAHYPMVGAVVVKAGRRIAEGWFQKPGGPHAEVLALQAAGGRACGATLILNLEPCSHFGRTPPCADAVIAAGIKRVVAGMTDPNPLVCGKGFAKLRAAGIEVVTGVLEEECRELNRVFVKYITTLRPYVIMKAAATLDGKIAAPGGDSRWVSGPASRRQVHRLREQCQAVMVGSGTVRRDDPGLTVRLGRGGRHPRPVVVSSKLRLPAEAKIFSTPAAGGPLLFCTPSVPAGRVKKLQAAGAEVVVVKANREGLVELAEVMCELGERKIASVLLEGGSALFGAMLRAGLVDEAVIFLAPRLLGGDGIGMTSGPAPAKIAHALSLKNLKVRKTGGDLMITAKIAGGADSSGK